MAKFAGLHEGGRALWTGLVELIYPSRCWVCEQPMPAERVLVCAPCQNTLAADPHATCARCASTVGPYVVTDGRCLACRKEPFHFEGVTRLGLYEDRLREVVLRMKQVEGEGLAEAVGAWWGGPMLAKLAGQAFDAIVPIPLHWQRRWHRGFNQSEYLAHGLSQAMKLPCETRWLRRLRRTAAQQSLPGGTARRQNVRDSFGLCRGVKLNGVRVLLVDDVLTSGATASEAAHVLKDAGASAVHVAVLGRGGQKGN